MAGKTAITYKIEGLNELLTTLKEYPKEVQEEVKEEIDDFAQRVVKRAKQRVPKDLGGGGGLSGAIGYQQEQGLIVAAKKYAPFVEFGTGDLVDVPAGLEDYAIQFKGRGIRKVNLKARPFFFNSFFEEKPKLLDRLKKLLNAGPN
jgi:hypothetical protein